MDQKRGKEIRDKEQERNEDTLQILQSLSQQHEIILKNSIPKLWKMQINKFPGKDNLPKKTKRNRKPSCSNSILKNGIRDSKPSYQKKKKKIPRTMTSLASSTEHLRNE